MKKISILSLFTLILFFSSLTVNADTYLGDIYYWYNSEGSYIGDYESSNVYIGYTNVDNSFEGDYFDYLSHARSQWNNNLDSSILITLGSGDIEAYFGSYEKLKELEPGIGSNNTGYSTWSDTYKGYYKYYPNGHYDGNKYGEKLNSSKIYVVYKEGRTSDQYKNTTTHELGHALGWYGHSLYDTDIMYDTATSITNLSDRDIKHLAQVY